MTNVILAICTIVAALMSVAIGIVTLGSDAIWQPAIATVAAVLLLRCGLLLMPADEPVDTSDDLPMVSMALLIISMFVLTGVALLYIEREDWPAVALWVSLLILSVGVLASGFGPVSNRVKALS